jgi:diacylglycerol O-acyltransferase / wax synthase
LGSTLGAVEDAATPLSAADARILALESDAVLGHTLKLVVLEPGPPLDLDAVRTSVRGRLAQYPPALRRVAATPGGPVWVPVDAIDMDAHVRRYAASTFDDLRQVVSALMSQHLDRARPLWTIDLVGPLDDGREAVAVRIHHAMADGMGAVRFLDAVLFEPHGAPPHAVGMRDPAVSAAASAWQRWRQMPAAVAREWGMPGSRSPFDRSTTSARELSFTDLPLAGLKAIGASRPERATVNDVLLAVVAAGLRRWHDTSHVGHALPRLRAQVPVSLHTAGEDAAAGNRDSFFNVDLLLHESDDVRRLDGISAQTRERKSGGDAQLMDELLSTVGRSAALAAAARQVTESAREFGVAISNVPGPRVPVAVAGRRVEHLYTSSEPGAHHALRIAAISNDEWMGVGFCVDPGAVADVAGLAEAVHDGFAALRDAVS